MINDKIQLKDHEILRNVGTGVTCETLGLGGQLNFIHASGTVLLCAARSWIRALGRIYGWRSPSFIRWPRGLNDAVYGLRGPPYPVDGRGSPWRMQSAERSRSRSCARLETCSRVNTGPMTSVAIRYDPTSVCPAAPDPLERYGVRLDGLFGRLAQRRDSASTWLGCGRHGTGTGH
jgi:hypothetical protein